VEISAQRGAELFKVHATLVAALGEGFGEEFLEPGTLFCGDVGRFFWDGFGVVVGHRYDSL